MWRITLAPDGIGTTTVSSALLVVVNVVSSALTLGNTESRWVHPESLVHNGFYVGQPSDVGDPAWSVRVAFVSV